MMARKMAAQQEFRSRDDQTRIQSTVGRTGAESGPRRGSQSRLGGRPWPSAKRRGNSQHASAPRPKLAMLESSSSTAPGRQRQRTGAFARDAGLDAVESPDLNK